MTSLEGFISLGSGLFTAGVAWGTIRASLHGTNKRLDQHIEDSNTWRVATTARLDSLTASIIGAIKP